MTLLFVLFLDFYLTEIVHLLKVSFRTPNWLFFSQILIPSDRFLSACCSCSQEVEEVLVFWMRWKGEKSKSKRDKTKVKEVIISMKYFFLCRHTCPSVRDLLLLSHSQRIHHMEKKAGAIDKSPPKVHNKVM